MGQNPTTVNPPQSPSNRTVGQRVATAGLAVALAGASLPSRGGDPYAAASASGSVPAAQTPKPVEGASTPFIAASKEELPPWLKQGVSGKTRYVGTGVGATVATPKASAKEPKEPTVADVNRQVIQNARTGAQANQAVGAQQVSQAYVTTAPVREIDKERAPVLRGQNEVLREEVKQSRLLRQLWREDHPNAGRGWSVRGNQRGTYSSGHGGSSFGVRIGIGPGFRPYAHTYSSRRGH